MDRCPDIGFDSYDRFFPSQDTMPAGGFGNLIALPLQSRPREKGNSVFLDDDFRPYEDQWAYLSTIDRLSRGEPTSIVAEAAATGRIIGARLPSTEDEDEPWTALPSRRGKEPSVEGELPGSVEVVLGNQVYIDRTKLPSALVNRIARLAAFQNSGVNLLAISAGHSLDAVEAILGPVIEVDARAEILWPLVNLTDTGEQSVRETADHVSVLGKTRSGAAFTVEISGGAAAEDARFRFEIRGSEGWLSLSSDHPYGFQAGDLRVTSNIPFTAPDEAMVSGGLMGAAINVGEVYAQLVHDVRGGTYSTPGFEHDLRNARLMEAVRCAAERGERQKATPLHGHAMGTQPRNRT